MSTNLSTSLGTLLEPVVRCFTPEVARRLIELRADAAIQARVDELAERANEGTLNADEQAEYDMYVEAADIIGILQAKARTVFAQQAS